MIVEESACVLVHIPFSNNQPQINQPSHPPMHLSDLKIFEIKRFPKHCKWILLRLADCFLTRYQNDPCFISTVGFWFLGLDKF